jgi:hypothetical protein
MTDSHTQSSGQGYDSTRLLACKCCGCTPAIVPLVPSLASSIVYSAECACGRRSAWWCSSEQAKSDWNKFLGFDDKYECAIRATKD